MPDSCCDDTFWQDQLTQAKAAAAAYAAAILALTTGGIASYTLETGQTRQVVTKIDVTELQNKYASILNLVATLEQRLCGSGSTHIVPNF